MATSAHPALAKAPAATPARYDGFERMLVDGTWRQGGSGRVSEDVDPYTNEVLVRIPLADERDLDEDFTTVHWVSVQHTPIRYPT